MKKLLSILITLTLVLGLTAAFAFESSAAGIVSIYEAAKDPVVDGKIDSEGYRLICKTGDDATGYLKTWEGCTVDDSMELWACWKGDFLYIAVKVVCNGEHVAYMDNAGEHYIFNAHHLMTCICPDDPYKNCYVGDNEDGSWSWGGLYNKQFIYEWTIINPSQDTDSDIADHFCGMSGLEGFEYKVVTEGGFDVYEQKIPLSKMTTSEAPNGVKGQVGSLFGFGFQLGLTDWGTGYTDETYQDYVYYSEYFTGAKKVVGMAYCKLVSDIEKEPSQEESTEEPAAPEAMDTVCDIFPTLDGLWTKTDHDGASVNIEYSQGKTVINGSVSGTWPSATANFPTTLYVGEGTYLVYDFSFESGTTSIRFNADRAIHTLIPDAPLESGSDDLQPGEYSGAISYEQLAELMGTNEDGLVVINGFTVYSVNGAEITFNTFKLDPAYVPPVVEDPDDESLPAESETESETESEPEDESVPATDDSTGDTSAPAGEEDGGNTGLIIGIVAGVVAIVAIVVVVVILKKKKA